MRRYTAVTSKEGDATLRKAEKILGKLELKLRRDPEPGEEDLKRYYLLSQGALRLWRRCPEVRPLVFYEGQPEALLREVSAKVPGLSTTALRLTLFPLEYDIAGADVRRFLSEMTELVSASTEYLLSMGSDLDAVLAIAHRASGDQLRQRLGKDEPDDAINCARAMLLDIARERLDDAVSTYSKLLCEDKIKDFMKAMWLYIQMLAYCEAYTGALEIYDDWLGSTAYSLSGQLNTSSFFDTLDSRKTMSAKIKEDLIPELTEILSLPDGYWDPIEPLLDRAGSFPVSCEMTEADKTELRVKLKDMVTDGLQFVLGDVSHGMAYRLAEEKKVK